MRARGRVFSLLLLSVLAGVSTEATAQARGEWPYYGADAGGTRYSPLTQIDRDNVEGLELAWEYSTGELMRRGQAMITNSSTQTTPILVENTLLLCTPFNRLIALDPATGRERWAYDARVDSSHALPFQYNCRGVSAWRDPQAAPASACAHRVFMGTNDSRLIAVDLTTGRPCAQFGTGGEVRVPIGAKPEFPGELKLTSAPAVVNGIVAVGSAIMDNLRTDAPPGTVHAFDARTGAPRWSFDPIPRDPADPVAATWQDGSAQETGAANVWSTMVVDAARNLIFLPVGSASPDFWGGERKGDNKYSSSLVALDAGTGQPRWHFQHVHHDIWDYDTPSPPMLIDIRRGNEQIPAVVQNTKQGFSFVLHRDTGVPVFGVEERPVPQGALPGEWLSPTQPFPLAPEPLLPLKVTPDDAWGFTFWDRARCREKIASLRNEGIFTPPSTAPGTLLTPGTAGGMNWGGPAYDPSRQLMIVNVSNAPQVVILVPREKIAGVRGISLEAGNDVAEQRGTPYGARREWLLSPWGAPCVKPPWGELVAVRMTDGKILWRSALGSIEKQLPVPFHWKLGTPNIGGPIVTGGGLIFIGATMDGYLRAFDVESGEELWREEMPAGTQTTPMTYEAGGRQYVVMVTGHHLWFGSKAGDKVVAYALPKD
ncbi:MAG TPA: pyrroloquinoline quinone-dependent dehydrogenase [Steroidobacteraceae bacterium]|nr:pyrroloquinoline quinone-dependent dehydrogenase [Steroidobacteraceae bacterium]